MHSVCFVPRSVIFLRETLRSRDWHIRAAASPSSNGNCSTPLESTEPRHPQTSVQMWAGLANDILRNNSSAPHSFYLCRCFSSLIYRAKKVMVRVVLWPVAPMSARKGGLGPPPTAQQQRVTHSESKGADTEHRGTPPAINSIQ